MGKVKLSGTKGNWRLRGIVLTLFLHLCCRFLSHDARVGDRGDKRNSQSERCRTLCGETQRSHTFLWHHSIWPRELPATAGLYFFPPYFNHLFIRSHFILKNFFLFLYSFLLSFSYFPTFYALLSSIVHSLVSLFLLSVRSFLSLDYLFVTLFLPSSFYFFIPSILNLFVHSYLWPYLFFLSLLHLSVINACQRHPSLPSLSACKYFIVAPPPTRVHKHIIMIIYVYWERFEFLNALSALSVIVFLVANVFIPATRHLHSGEIFINRQMHRCNGIYRQLCMCGVHPGATDFTCRFVNTPNTQVEIMESFRTKHRSVECCSLFIIYLERPKHPHSD